MTRAGSSVPKYTVQGDGPLLVYIAGLDGTGKLLFKQLPLLTPHYRVVTYRSRESGRFVYEDLCDDVAGIIRDLGEKQATIVAESFGGTVALNLALLHPEVIDRLIIVNSFSKFRSPRKINLGVWLARVLSHSLTGLLRRGASTIGLIADRVTPADRKRFYKSIRTVPKPGYVRRLELIASLDLDQRLREIETSTLLIAGTRDLLLPSAREAEAMAKAMPNATVRLIEGAGHACLMGDRVNLADVIVEWRAREVGTST
jgi:pimeloyl-ACP methyl ester carboxylesterase